MFKVIYLYNKYKNNVLRNLIKNKLFFIAMFNPLNLKKQNNVIFVYMIIYSRQLPDNLFNQCIILYILYIIYIIIVCTISL